MKTTSFPARATPQDEGLLEIEQRYKMLFDSIDEGFCVIEILFDDAGTAFDYRFLEVNRAFEKQTGLKNVAGRTIRELEPRHEKTWFDIYGRVATAGEPIRFQNHSATLRRWFDVYAFRVGDPQQNKVAVLFNDITERKQTEESLLRSNRDLELFAAVASHDLQEPLRKIQSFTDRLRTVLEPKLSPEEQRYLVRIIDSAARMSHLIENLLNYSKLTADNKFFSEVDLNGVIKEAISDLELRILDTKAEVTYEELPVLYANRYQMRQLFQNLISNSLKYSRKEENPVIHISGACSAEECVITVRDNGIGFDEKYRDLIFKPFQRLYGRSEFEGTGIGLAICEKIVTHHGGRISAASEKNRGSTFTIRLPIDPQHQDRNRCG